LDSKEGDSPAHHQHSPFFFSKGIHAGHKANILGTFFF